MFGRAKMQSFVLHFKTNYFRETVLLSCSQPSPSLLTLSTLVYLNAFFCSFLSSAAAVATGIYQAT